MTETPEEEEVTTPPAPEQQEVIPPPTPPSEIANTELAYADHRTYAQALYQQPVYVVDAVFSTGGLDQSEKHTPNEVSNAIVNMMSQPDKQFEEVQ